MSKDFTDEKAAPLNVQTVDAADDDAVLSMQDKGTAWQTTDEIDPEEEKRLLRKVDMRLVPSVFIMYLFSYLDRSNVGNAYTVSNAKDNLIRSTDRTFSQGGMQKDLNMSSNAYSVVLLVFFISYVLFEPISNAILTRVRPSIYLPTLMFLWGILSCCFAAAKTWQTIAGLRFLLGVLESSFAPGVLFMLSAWYKRCELGRRYSLYYTAVAISGIFGGLIAGGLIDKLDGARGIAGWRWLFIVEGAGTCVVSLASLFLLPDFPTSTRWLTPDERTLASRRLTLDSVGDTQSGTRVGHKEAARMAVTDWRTWAFVLTYMCTTGAQTIQYFIPQLVKSMGYTGFHIQYMTAPIYACALVAILAFGFSSDRFNERPYHLASASALAIVCFACLIGVLNNTGRYVLLCFGVAGVYAACPLVSVYVSNSIPHPSEKRAIAQAIVNALGNSASIYGSFLFPANAADHNRMGFAVTMVFMVLAFAMAFVLRYFTAKYPYPSLQQPGSQSNNEVDAEGGIVPALKREPK